MILQWLETSIRKCREKTFCAQEAERVSCVKRDRGVLVLCDPLCKNNLEVVNRQRHAY